MYEGIKHNKKEIAFLRDSFKESQIFSRITSLIVHGSSLYYPIKEKEGMDIDLELILTSQDSYDYEVVKSIIISTPVKTECQIRYLNEIQDGGSLIYKSSYKTFMYFAYKNGVCLLGENVYDVLTFNILEEEVKRSILVSTQISFKNVRKLFLANAPVWEVNKSIARTFTGICLYENFFSYKDIGNKNFIDYERDAFIPIILERYGEFLGLQETAILQKFQGYFKNQTLFTDIFSVLNKIVSIFEERTG